MSTLLRPTPLFLLFCLVVQAVAIGAETPADADPQPAANAQIMVALQDVTLQPDGKTTVRIRQGNLFRVLQVNGEQLRVENLDESWVSWIAGSHLVSLQQGLEHFDKQIQDNPDDGMAIAARGRLHEALGDATAGLNDLNQAVDKGYTQARLYRGLYWLKTRKLDDAISDFSELIASNTLVPQAQLFRAQTYFTRGVQEQDNVSIDNSLADLDKAVEYPQVKLAAYLARANIRALRKEYAQAASDYTAAIDMGAAQALANRATVWLAMGKFDSAVEDLTALIDRVGQLAPDAPPAAKTQLAQFYVTRARASQGKRDNERANADLEVASQLAPDDPFLQRTRGLLRYSEGKFAEAVTDLSSVTRQNPRDLEARLALARSLEFDKQYEASMTQYEQVAALVPGDPRPKLGMTSLRLTRDPAYRNIPEAIRHATDACEITGWKFAGAVKALMLAHINGGQIDTAEKLLNQHRALFDAEAVRTMTEEMNKIRARQKTSDLPQ